MFSIRSSALSAVASAVALLAALATVLAATASPLSAQVQPPEVEWERTFGGTGLDHGFSVWQTTDGGYVVAGDTDPSGGGSSYDVYLLKMDALGVLLWMKTFGGMDQDQSYSVQQTDDGGYVVTGQTGSFGDVTGDVYLVKTDTQGNLIWQQTFGGTNSDSGKSVKQTSDDGYVVVGYTNSLITNSADVYLVKTDTQGNLIWQQTFGGSGSDFGLSIRQTIDGGYVLCGLSDSFGNGLSDVFLVKTDSQGQLVWQKTYGGTDDDFGSSVQQANDGGHVLTGVTRSFGAGLTDVYLLKTDAEGTLQWQQTFGGENWDNSSSVQLTVDGGFIVAGGTSSFGAGSSDVYLIKTDANGDMLWQNTYGGASGDMAFSVQQTNDGGYIIAGATDSFGAGMHDVYLIKLKPDQPPPPPKCSEDAEAYDEMATELSHSIEVFGLGRVCTADLVGTIGVKRYLPYVDPQSGLRTIETKITKLELTGTDPTCGEINISLNPNLASGGKVVEQKAGTCFPADSFFDVYITVAIPSLNRTLANCQPATMRCTVSALPPIGCVYQLGTGFDVPLYDASNLNCATPGNPVGQISAADHKPTQDQGTVVLPPPERIQLNFYDPTTNQWLPLPDQVRKDYFQPTLPVVIIVHGWNIDFLDHLAPWSNEVASAIAARLPDPSNPIRTKVNILAWDWMEEARGGTRETPIRQQVQNSAQQTPDQARKLARELQRLFQANPTTRFEKPIHLMGHSHGSILSVLCALQLQNPAFGGGTYPVANVTLWDPLDQFELFGTVFTFGNSLPVNVPLLRERGTVVDCFTGTLNVLTYFANVWYVVPGSLLDPGRGHDTYRWYQTHLLEAVEPTLHRRFTCDDTTLPSTVGFGASATHAAAVRQLRLDVCQPAERDVSLVAHSAARGCTARDEFVYAQYCLANAGAANPLITYRLDLGIGNRNCECTVPPDLDPEHEGARVRMRLRRPGQGAGGQAEPLTATYTLPLAVAPAWDYLQFTYRIEAAPSPATLTLSIQDGAEVVPMFLTTSDTDLGELADTSLLTITPYHGKEVSLIFSLSSAEPDAIVEVSNLTFWQGPFHDNVAPVADAGQNQAVAVTDPLATPVALDGSGTTDTNGDALVYVWTATQDPANAEEGIIAVGVQPTVDLPLGGYQFTLHARDPFDGFSFDSVIVEVEHPFTRGDSNADGLVNITDAIASLTRQFVNLDAPLCLDAADTNDDGVVNITDPIALLNYLFLGTAPAPKPPTFPDAGLDPTPDLLGCDLRRP